MTHITIERAEMEQVLEALQWSKPHKDAEITHSEAITAIVEALAQECPNLKNCKGACFQCEYFNVDTGMMEYPAAQPAQRPWVGLVNKDKVLDFGDAHVTPEFARGALWAEAKLKEMNT
jgi:hypothetical protein